MKKKGGRSMTIQITRPEVEALINQRLQGGGFKDAEDVILQALQASPTKPARTPQPDVPPAKNIEELFARCRASILISAATPRPGGP
jgi:hypothetical protein